MPDPTTAFIDPLLRAPTLSLVCSVADPILGEPYGRDPRFVAQKAERHLVNTGIADVAYFGPRLSSSCSTTSPTRRPRTGPFTRSTPKRGSGTRATG